MEYHMTSKKKFYDSDHGERQSYVMVNNNWIPVSETEFLNIEEDLQGYDLMTFKYKEKQYRSRVTIR